MEKLWDAIGNLVNEDNIALLSVIITVIIFIFSRQAEIRYKKYDAKKIEYLKLIELLEISRNGEMEISEEMQKKFFDTGASLLLYGSKKIYRQYLLFREFVNNPLIKQCKYYDSSIIIYIISDILVTMRKEVGLNSLNNIEYNEALAFFVNDISYNPIAKEKAIDAKFRIKMIRFEIVMLYRCRFIGLQSLYKGFVKPIFAGIKIVFKYVVMVPIGKIITKLFPEFVQKVLEKKKEERK